jgi:hypothetical protein
MRGDGNQGDATQATNPFPPPVHQVRWDAAPSEQTTQVMAAVPRDTGGGDFGQGTRVVQTGAGGDAERILVTSADGLAQRGGRQALPDPCDGGGQVRDGRQPIGSHLVLQS